MADSKQRNQSAPEDQGVNLKGKAPNAPRRRPGAFMGRSGQADNSETFRKAGRT